MGDRPGTSSRVRTSEDKVRRKDVLVCEGSLCPIKLPDVSGPGLGEAADPGLNRIDRILISISCNFFSGSRSRKNSKVKCAWPGAISGWVTDRELLSGCARVRTKCAEKTCVGL